MAGNIPDWIVDEIRNSVFEDPREVRRTGYILDILEDHDKIDVQLYEPVDDGRYIVTLDISEGVDLKSMEKGIVYNFQFESRRAPLSEKAIKFLRSEKGISMDAVYQFVLTDAAPLDRG